MPHHPRVNEVNKRIDNQQQRIDKGVANGTITPKQALRDEQHDANIAQRASAYEARHNGHLTKKEDRNLNRAENRNSRHIRQQRGTESPRFITAVMQKGPAMRGLFSSDNGREAIRPA